MSEVRVKIGADIRDLQKGVRDSQKELASLAADAKRASSSLSSTGKSIEQIKAEARAALAPMKDITGELEAGAGAASRFGSIVKGGLFLGAVATSAQYLGDKLVEAFTKGQRAAEEARKAFAAAVPGAVQFGGGSDPLQARSREDILKVFQTAEANVRRLDALIEESQGGILKQSLTFVRSFLDPMAETQIQVIDALKQQRGEAQGIADAAGAAFAQYEAQQKIARSLADLGLQTKSAIEGQAEALKEVRKAEEDLLKLRARAFAAVPGAPTPLGSSDTRKVPAASNFGVDPSQFQIFPNAGNEDADTAQRVKAVLDAQAALNAQLAEGRDLFTELGVQGVAALADVALGFEKVGEIGNIARDIVKNLIRDLAIASARAAAVSLLFPGAGAAAGGIKGLLGNFLGVPKLAAGGVVTKPTLSLIGEAGPEAVVPLSKLGGMAGGSVKVEPFFTTIRGNDLVIGFQQARKQAARTVGNIPLK